MARFCICLQTLIPVRIHPSERAEMVTQIIFGEIYTIEETTGNWTKILTSFDNYEGWIDKKINYEISEKLFHSIQLNENKSSQKIISYLNNAAKSSSIPLVAGSSLPFIDENGKFTIDTHKYEYEHNIQTLESTGDTIVYLAKKFENAPYLWGGRTVLGIDCSGLVQIVYKMIGIALHRDASMQISQGKPIGFINEAKPGDLAFFDNEEGQIVHVGILIDHDTIIHASGWVRIDRIDHQGIFNSEKNTYSHKLRIIKRILNQ